MPVYDKINDISGIDVSALPKHFAAAEIEQRWRERWKVSSMRKYDENFARKDAFVIDSPPPTVSGSLHVGHIFSYTHQDIIARHRRMMGMKVIYPMGWDDNGLPTERRVQNYYGVQADASMAYDPLLNLKDKADDQSKSKSSNSNMKVSRLNFIELCEKVTSKDEVAFEGLFQRMGFSISWDDKYTTLGHKARRIAQRSFLDLFEKGHIYQAESPTMWDTDFQTAVAQAEVQDREMSGTYSDIEFGLHGEEGSFVISTTRPELLAACVGVTAHPEDRRYAHLFGKTAVTPCFFAKVPIFPSTIADPEKGTGIIMVCTFGDQTDVAWWREKRLDLRQIVGRDGRLEERTFGVDGWDSLSPEQANKNYAFIANRRISSARRVMLEMLQEPANSPSGKSAPLVAEPRTIRHTVRFYEQGESPLEYLTTRQWFVRLLDKKEELLKFGHRIRWYPDFMLKRFENWTQNLNTDWCISRQRFSGVPIPVWYPLDEHGNRNYAKPVLPYPHELPVDPLSQMPHSSYDKEIPYKNNFAGETDVFDTWFTSSLTPQIVSKWGEPDSEMERMFPMDIRPQSHEIIRTWAFYTIVKAMLHHGEIPWRNAVISGWILDPDRKKMSKSRGNAVIPAALLDKHGVDAIRYWSGSARLGTDTAFDEKVFKIGRKLVTKIYNASKFVLGQSAPKGRVTNELDCAFLGELMVTIRKATEAMERFEYALALEETEKFFWNAFTDNYIELVKTRAHSEDDIQGRISAVATLRAGLSVLLRMFAPILPFITEEVWSWNFADETACASIHSAPWPGTERDLGQYSLEGMPAPDNAKSFQSACEAIYAVRKAKTEAGIRLGASLQEVEIYGPREWLDLVKPIKEDVMHAAGASEILLSEDINGTDKIIAKVTAV